MRIATIAVASVGLLALSGCAAAEYEPATDAEASVYVDVLRVEGGPLVDSLDDAELVEQGELVCKFAHESGGFEAAAEYVGAEMIANGSANSVTYWGAVLDTAEGVLCPSTK